MLRKRNKGKKYKEAENKVFFRPILFIFFGYGFQESRCEFFKTKKVFCWDQEEEQKPLPELQ